MKNSWRLKTFLPVLAALAGPACVSAGEISLYCLPGAQAEYEGTGYRQTANGWELKVKPRSFGGGFRWRHTLSSRTALQVQGWGNAPACDREDGNSLTGALRQTGRTQLAFQTLMADLRRSLAGSSVEALAGLQVFRETFRRRSIVFNQMAEPGSAHEALQALGACAGFHGGREPGGNGFYWDGEAALGHFFLTDNKLKAGGGSIRRDGFSYAFRLEGGWLR